MLAQVFPLLNTIILKQKRYAIALAVAGFCSFNASPLMAQTTIIGDNDTQVMNVPSDTLTGDTLILGNASGGDGTLNFTSGTLNFGNAGDYSGFVTVGNSGAGAINQDNSNGDSVINITGPQYVSPASTDLPTAWGGYLFAGRNDGGAGIYTMTDSGNGNALALNVQNAIQLGGSNVSMSMGGGFSCTSNCFGSFIQNGGIVTTGQVTIGIGGGTGSYTLNDGTLNAFIDLGNSSGSDNTFTQNGGTVNGDMFIGNAGKGTYAIIDGLVNSGSFIGIGYLDTGSFQMSGGVVNSTSILVGVNNMGTFAQIAGDHFAHEVLFGTDVGGNGSYNLDDGTLTIGDGSTDRLVVGHNSQGTFNMTGGMLTILNNDINTAAFVVGNNAGSVGVFTQSGGEVQGARSLGIGSNGGVGTYNLNTDLVNGTTPLLNTGFISLGFSGTGTFNQQNGTTNTTGALYIGADHGVYNLYGGDLIVGEQGTTIGTFNVGEFNQSGGTHTTDFINMGQHAGSTATYNLSGGDLIVNNQMVVGHGDTDYSTGLNGLFMQSGGTVSAHDIVIGGYTDYSDPLNPVSNLGTGRYEFSDGSIRAKNTTVGNLSQGSVLQTGGTFNAGSLTLGSSGLFSITNSGVTNFYSSGSYDLQGGTLNTYGTTVALFGLGTFNQSGTSEHNINGNLVIGGGPSLVEPASGQVREGTYTLLGDTLLSILTVGGDTIIGAGNLGTFVGEPGGKGTFTQSGGTHTVSGNLILGQGSDGDASTGATGAYLLSDGVLHVGLSSIIGGGTGFGGTGIFTQTGGTQTVVGDVTVAEGTGNHGTYNLSGGTLTATNLVNNDAFNYTGGNLYADINNSGAISLSGAGTRTINGNVTNTGTFSVSNTTVVVTGDVTNSGVYNTDPSYNIVYGNLTVSPSGYIVAGAGDSFSIGGSFLNESTNNTLWDTSEASVGFFGSDDFHVFSLAGADQGSVMNGYINNFAWGTLDLTAGQITLTDGNTTSGGALYVDAVLGAVIIGNTIANIIGVNDLNIYYLASLAENSYLGGNSFLLENGGELIPVNPVPLPAAVLLFGSGLAVLMGVSRKRRSKKS